MSISYSYINGKIFPNSKAKISLFDRGLFLGDGLFETLKTIHGKPIFWKEHYQRLINSSKKLEFSSILSATKLRTIIESLCSKSNTPHSMVRIIITRGVYNFSLEFDSKQPTHIFVTLKDLSNIQAKQTIKVLTLIQKPNSFGNLKHINYLPQITSQSIAKRKGFQDALMINNRQNIQELTSANFFCVIRGVLLTPPMNSFILPGIIRAKILLLAKKNNWKIKKRNINIHEIENLDEAFATSSIRGIIPITQINDIKLNKPLFTWKWFSIVSQAVKDWELQDI